MKIVILNYEYPPVGGGAATASREIAIRLRKFGHQVRIYTTSFPSLPVRDIDDGLEVIRLHTGRKKLERSRLIELWKFHHEVNRRSREIEQFGTEVILAFFSIPSGYTAFRFNQRLGIPFIVSLRGADVPGFYSSRLVEFINFFSRPLHCRIWRTAYTVVANSTGLRDLTRQVTCFRAPIEIIPNGVDSQLFSPAGDYRFSGRLLFVGRLAKQKGVELLIHALSELGRNDWSLTIVGDGPEKPDLQRLVESYAIGDAIEWKGWVGRDELPDIYRSANIFLMPSYAEGMSNAVLEALACGLPAIAGDVPGVEILIRHSVNGWLFKTGDATDLRDCIRKVFEQSDRLCELARDSRKTALTFSWDNVTCSYNELLEAAVRKSND